MEGKSVEEIIAFMDDNERSLRENPFEKRVNPVIISEEKEEQSETDNNQENSEN
jgi:hypothetical protein